MGVTDRGTIDGLSVGEDGVVTLIIEDDLDWSSEVAHLQVLQLKLADYMGHIESGKLRESHPDATGIKVSVIFRHLPEGEAYEDFFIHAANHFQVVGAEFTFSVRAD